MTIPDTTPAITGEDEWGIKGVAADVVDMARDKQLELAPTLTLNRDAAIGNAVIAISGLLDRSAATLRQQLQAVRAENAEMREAARNLDVDLRLCRSFYEVRPGWEYNKIALEVVDVVCSTLRRRRAANPALPPAPEDGG